MINTIVNLTQHVATPDQVNAGVTDLTPALHDKLKQLLTFDELPFDALLEQRARMVVQVALAGYPGAEQALIGGAPYFMPYLERELWRVGIEPLYAFSQRAVFERPDPENPNRNVKVSSFKHIGFVLAIRPVREII